jgi:hypothetical protein
MGSTFQLNAIFPGGKFVVSSGVAVFFFPTCPYPQADSLAALGHFQPSLLV